jgi:hypothetical protein
VKDAARGRRHSTVKDASMPRSVWVLSPNFTRQASL